MDEKDRGDIPRKFSIEVLIQLWVDFVITTNPLYDFRLTLLRPYVGNEHQLLQGRGLNQCGGVSFAHGGNGFPGEFEKLLPDIRSFLPECFGFKRFATDVLQDKFDVQRIPSFAYFMKGSNHTKILDTMRRCEYLGKDELETTNATDKDDKDGENEDDDDEKEEMANLSSMKKKGAYVYTEFMKCLRKESGKYTPAMRANAFALMVHLDFIVPRRATTTFSIDKPRLTDWFIEHLLDSENIKTISLKTDKLPKQLKQGLTSITRAMPAYEDPKQSTKRKAETDDSSASVKKAKTPLEPFCIQPSGSTDDADDTTMTSSYQGMESEDEFAVDVDDIDPTTPRKNLCPTMEDQYQALAKSTSSTKSKVSRRSHDKALLIARRKTHGKPDKSNTPKRHNKKTKK